MNTISYGILGIINAHSSSGYDIMNYLKPFREVKHSQIYRTLANLEKDEFVTSEIVEQADKPNKKVYTITEKGKEVIEEWFYQPNAPALLRDEFVLKAFLVGLQDKAEAKQLFNERIKYLEKKARVCNERLDILKADCDGVLTDFQTLEFGRYILLQQLLHQTYVDIRWCQWVLDLLDKDKLNFLTYPF
ncbi:DNA-binding PadR family transcriptional regulator [Pullulanibacillus pueri]|uniref:Negative transcription regulator PadR n=1 Tax=Pullulanibacillus pueri TaxID=1437324 RepID=A0A8J3ENP4_9BACL|nr:PadR family transcriptional regulator [Pullulanibacillus pueri]MBM7683757.1 DNA-binding PadR family transcriptional regulator [Pullulanibacillus pueri]GGH87332.1 negative transcription regulator PadR [Pullulanibacillus pueri]